jgi:hypothetical protein
MWSASLPVTSSSDAHWIEEWVEASRKEKLGLSRGSNPGSQSHSSLAIQTELPRTLIAVLSRYSPGGMRTTMMKLSIAGVSTEIRCDHLWNTSTESTTAHSAHFYGPKHTNGMYTVCSWTDHSTSEQYTLANFLHFYFFNNGKSIGTIDQHETSLSYRSMTPLFFNFRHYSATFCLHLQSWRMRHHVPPKHQYLHTTLHIAS